jgi:GT2 family glycosyltransferase
VKRAATSIVISTRNRSELLKGALDALLCQSADEYEVLVVDNDSSDATRAVVGAFAARSDGRIKYLHEPRPGVSHGRNRGIAASTASYVAFTDDDVRVAPDWLEAGLRTLRDAPRLAYAGGRVLPLWPRERPAWLTPEHWPPLAAVDYGDTPFVVPSDRAVCLITANLLVRREALNQVGWFDPSFQRCQDHELMLRLWRAGLAGAYNPAMLAATVILPERLDRSYHRRWHATQGNFLARMPLRERVEGLTCTIESSSEARSLLGAPLFEYRALLQHAGAWAASMTCGRLDRAFVHELRARYSLAFLWASVTLWAQRLLSQRERQRQLS